VTAAFETEDITAPEVIRDPYAYFGRLRDTDPVHWNPLVKSWVVTSHAEVVWLIRHHEQFSSESPFVMEPDEMFPPVDEADWELARHYSQTYRPFIFYDRPEHLYMRQAVHQWFTPKAVERWRAELRASVHELIDNRLPDGEMELKEDLAAPLPLKTISWMLGVPYADAPRLRDVVSVFETDFTPRRFRAIDAAWGELQAYFEPLLEARAKNPAEDLISMLADAERRGVFTRDSCLASISLLMQAGHETTLSLITSGLLSFIRNPAQWDLLRSDPASVCVPATEECLRYEPSVKLLVRRCAQDVELAGKQIQAGDMVNWVPSAANRDPRVFPDPDTFDITRSPNPHVAFGGGIHHCLGAALARVEGQEALRVLAETFPRLELRNDDVECIPSAGIRQVTSLPVSWN
jgi:cytochrome P450